MRAATFDAVLPVVRDDFDRAEVLFASLAHFEAPIGKLLVVVPDRDVSWVGDRLPASVPATVAAESDLVPELADVDRGVEGWFVQQLIKLAVADHIESEFYLTLDADVICVRRFDVSELIVDGRAVSNRRSGPRFEPEWYEWAVRVLQLPESAFVHGVTPALLSTEAVLGLQDHLAGLAGEGSWRSYLLDSIPWTEYVLYFTWLEATGHYERYHFAGAAGPETIYGNSVWLPDQELKNWDAEGIFGQDVPFQFAVVQSNHPTITTADVIERVGPFIGLGG